jgi:hypothetical protein
VDREKDSHLTKPSSDDGAYLGVYVRFYPDYTSTTGETAVVPMMVQRRGLIDVRVLGRVAYRIAGLARDCGQRVGGSGLSEWRLTDPHDIVADEAVSS